MVEATAASRREFLMGTAAAAAALWAGGARPGLAASSDPAELGLVQAVAAVKSKRITAAAYIEAMLKRGEALKRLGAFIRQDAALARAQAKAVDAKIAGGTDPGAIAGAAIAVKDNIDIAGLPTTAGTPGLKTNVPAASAPVAEAVIDSGGVVIGKTNMHELGFGITANNAAFGAVHNPYNPKLIPGGSSGGTAVAVAARLAAAGLGTDTGGSCRIPAALCGIVGFRPTLHRYAQRGVVPIAATRDTPGPLARTVEDVVMLDDVCATEKQAREEVSLKSVRIAVPRGYFYADLDPALAKVVGEALDQLKKAGAVLVEADLPDVKALNDAVSNPIALYEVLRELSAYLYFAGSKITVRDVVEQIAGPAEKALIASQLNPDKAIPAKVYQEAVAVGRPKLQAAYAHYFRTYTVVAMVVPTTPLPARPLGQEDTVELNGKQVSAIAAYVRNTDPPSNAGLPCLTVPAGLTSDGLPVGIEFVGPGNSDNRLLAIGRAYEKLRGTMPAPKL
jgi:Asp-tRNA(Asn)/Glu-tRNA(Gln) amidotransferase A subunit family amidase